MLLSRQGKHCLVYIEKIRNSELPLDCQLNIVDNPVIPILTYGCEVWGYGDLSAIKKVHTDFMNYIHHVKKSTPLYSNDLWRAWSISNISHNSETKLTSGQIYF